MVSFTHLGNMRLSASLIPRSVLDFLKFACFFLDLPFCLFGHKGNPRMLYYKGNK